MSKVPEGFVEYVRVESPQFASPLDMKVSDYPKLGVYLLASKAREVRISAPFLVREGEEPTADIQSVIDFLNAMPLNTEVAEAIGKALEEYDRNPPLTTQLASKWIDRIEASKQETWRDRPPML